MRDSRLPKKAYSMLCKIDDRGKRTWVSDIRYFLFQCGFGEAWYNQGVGNTKLFLRELKVRLIDCRWQNWNEHVHESSRFNMYLILSNPTRCIPKYLEMDLDRYLVILMTKFRFGISNLLVHYYRYRPRNTTSLLCPLCKTEEDNEVHLVLCCNSLNKLRNELIPQKYFRAPNNYQLNLLFNSQNNVVIRNLCVFLHKAFKVRNIDQPT